MCIYLSVHHLSLDLWLIFKCRLMKFQHDTAYTYVKAKQRYVLFYSSVHPGNWSQTCVGFAAKFHPGARFISKFRWSSLRIDPIGDLHIPDLPDSSTNPQWHDVIHMCMPRAWDHMQCPLYWNLFTVQTRLTQFALKKKAVCVNGQHPWQFSIW
jgi:hypothetical protein